MRVRIRESASADRESFWKATLETAWRDIPEDERAGMDRREFESYFRQAAGPYLDDPRNTLFVAEDEKGTPLGHTLLGQTMPFYSSKPYGFIFDIYVAEWARRQGVGRQLIEFAFKRFRDQGLEKVKLEVAEGNEKARPLYLKMGFTMERHVMGRSLR
jgi:ribosomal protein S18 acetylase RimI-like enzyme